LERLGIVKAYKVVGKGMLMKYVQIEVLSILQLQRRVRMWRRFVQMDILSVGEKMEIGG